MQGESFFTDAFIDLKAHNKPAASGFFFIRSHHARQSNDLAHSRNYGSERYLFTHSHVRGLVMAKFSVGALVQLKSGGIRGMVESQIEPDSDHPKAWVRWDDGNYSVHYEHELRAATVNEPRMYKKLA